MARIDRVPSIPIIANDPYFSYWVPADVLNEAHVVHWSDNRKNITGFVTVDGVQYRYLCGRGGKKMETRQLVIDPTRTISTLCGGGIELTVTFTSPLLLDDLDIMSTPITYVDYELHSTDGAEHEVRFSFFTEADLCHDGYARPAMETELISADGVTMRKFGRREQNVLSHSGDRITIDWGYLYLGAKDGEIKEATEYESRYTGMRYVRTLKVGAAPEHSFLMVGYDDIASINYFGYKAKAWYARHGQTFEEAMVSFARRHDEIVSRCALFDKQLCAEAEEIGGEDYRLIVCAGYRQSIAAHKLIATQEGEPAFLSKENDSNGCIGTVDVSYPSIPLFLKYAPELVCAMCRPIFRFARTPIWIYDYAPHDVGRYPQAIGQIYATKKKYVEGTVTPDFYSFAPDADIYTEASQMPVEESGNMLIMLEAAMTFGASEELVRKHADLLDRWVRYLDEYGEDPGDQLCTDDFAGHLARNINLSAKAFIGIECYARILERLGRETDSDRWHKRAHEMAASWLNRAADQAGGSYLTFDHIGWSMKYNLVWDKVLELGLIPEEFYKSEIKSYISRINEFGLPLDSRDTYTKSDWTLWTAAMAEDCEDFLTLIAPVAKFLRKSQIRVPFGDWYDTTDGRCIAFQARSVQGGLFMPMLLK